MASLAASKQYSGRLVNFLDVPRANISIFLNQVNNTITDEQGLFTIDISEPGSFVADVEIKNIDSNYKSIDFSIPQNESLGDWKPESVNLCGHI